MRGSRLLTLLFSLLGGLALVAGGCETETEQVKERKVEIKQDEHGTRIEEKEKKVITDEEGRQREVEIEKKTKTD